MSEKTSQINEALNFLDNLKGINIPKEVNIDEFLISLEHFNNKENFIEYLQKSSDAQKRLQYLNLIEPTFKEPDIILTKNDKKVISKLLKKRITPYLNC